MWGCGWSFCDQPTRKSSGALEANQSISIVPFLQSQAQKMSKAYHHYQHEFYRNFDI